MCQGVGGLGAVSAAATELGAVALACLRRSAVGKTTAAMDLSSG